MSDGTTLPELRCAICKESVPSPEVNPSFPFCSSRCRMIDLGRWVDGRYAIDVRTGKLDMIDPEEAEEVSDDDGQNVH